MTDLELLLDLSYSPWSSAMDIARRHNEDEASVRRILSRMEADELVLSEKLGMAKSAVHRYIVAPNGLEKSFATSHRHPTEKQIWQADEWAKQDTESPKLRRFNRRYDRTHEHLPFDDPSTHVHPPWSGVTRGARWGVRRLASLERIYEIAPWLLHGGHLKRENAPPGYVPPPLTQLRFLAKGSFYQCVAEYGPDVWVTFTFVGPHTSATALSEKYNDRYLGLVARDVDGNIGRAVDIAPQPSAHVIIGVDELASAVARNMFNGYDDVLIWCAHDGPDAPITYRPTRTRLGDPFETPALGDWKQLMEDLHNPLKWVPSRGKTAYRLFNQMFETVGLNRTMLADIQGVGHRVSGRWFDRFDAAGLTTLLDGGIYPHDEAFLQAAYASRVSLDTVAPRFEAFLGDGYRAQQQVHNQGLGKIFKHLALANIRIFGGWRTEVNVPGITQLKPDGWVQVYDGGSGYAWYAVEYERTAQYPGGGQSKGSPYVKLASLGEVVPVLFVCETEAQEKMLHQHGGRLRLWTTTLTRFIGVGPLEPVWLDTSGRLVRVLFRKRGRPSSDDR